MKAAINIDYVIAEKIFGWQEFPYFISGPNGGKTEMCPPGEVHVSTIKTVPPYSKNIEAAWEIVEKMSKYENEHVSDIFFGTITTDRIHRMKANDAALAICKAALRTIKS